MRRGALLIIIVSVSLSGQDDMDAVRPFTGLGGPGSRAGGLGLAFTGIADDITALHYNPAGLAHLTRAEFNLGLTYLNVVTDVSAQGTSNTATIAATRLGDLGFAFPIPGLKLTAALGFNQVRSFERRREQLFTYGEASTIREVLTEEGWLGTWSLGIAYQVSPQLALGGAVDILAGKNVYSWDSTVTTGMNVDTSDYILIKPEYSGVGLSLGVLIAPLPAWRIGLLLRSPQEISVDQIYRDASGFSSTYEYKSQATYYFRLGSSLTLGPVLISGDLFWLDYSQIRFESDLVDIVDSIKIPIDISINENLLTQYTPALGYAAGAELLLPLVNAKLRGGYRSDPPINKDSPAKMTQQTFALGLSVVPVPQVKIDAAYSLTSWQRDLSGDASETTSAGNMMVNLIYRF
ncbi:MAG: outer membrane protein transport protein [Fidelibacterota bacterium]|nr:MAG: outer membrane protein transport protein [Candidatus Neomarinimicrobiota bacterium]